MYGVQITENVFRSHKLKVKANSQILIVTLTSGGKLILHPGSVFLENLFSFSVERVGSTKSVIGFVIDFV